MKKVFNYDLFMKIVELLIVLGNVIVLFMSMWEMRSLGGWNDTHLQLFCSTAFELSVSQSALSEHSDFYYSHEVIVPTGGMVGEQLACTECNRSKSIAPLCRDIHLGSRMLFIECYFKATFLFGILSKWYNSPFLWIKPCCNIFSSMRVMWSSVISGKNAFMRSRISPSVAL